MEMAYLDLIYAVFPWVVQPASSLHEQLRIMTFLDGAPFETLHSFVSSAMKPYLNSAVNVQRVRSLLCAAYCCFSHHAFIIEWGLLTARVCSSAHQSVKCCAW